MEPEVIRHILTVLLILVASVTFHEFGHAFAADKLGDRLPRSQGRVTLNPVSHADPLGTLLFPALFLFLSKGTSTGFGWGRPVQVYPPSFTRRFSMRTGHMIVAFAGPAMNIVLALIAFGAHAIAIKAGWLGPESKVHEIFLMAVTINFSLFFFNLIPAPPLDGGAVLEGLLPAAWVPGFRKISVYGPFVLFAFLLIPELRIVVFGPTMFCVETLYGFLR